jgi:hypothetical protein
MAGMSPLMLWRDRVWINHFLMTVTAVAITKASNWMALMNTILRLGSYTTYSNVVDLCVPAKHVLDQNITFVITLF